VLIVATKQSVARNLFIKVGFMYDNLPSWLRGESPDEYNKLSLRLKNGSQVKAIASSDEMGRSEALSCLVIDEMALIENIET
jgi:phage terminase large subunit-like protein